MRKRNALEGKPAKCSGCGKAEAHVVLRVAGDPDKGHDWLCGSCEYLRANPEAKTGPVVKLPIDMRRRPLQKETLF